MSKKCEGEISLVRTEVLEYRHCEVTKEGNILVPKLRKVELLDIQETSVWCDKHYRLSTDDQYEAHGISEDWEEV